MTAIVEPVGQCTPALVGLALDVGLAGFPLGVQGVEFLLESLVGRLAGIDRATDHARLRRCHGAACPPPVPDRMGGSGRGDPGSPKKRGPDQRTPVIARAMAESD